MKFGISEAGSENSERLTFINSSLFLNQVICRLAKCLLLSFDIIYSFIKSTFTVKVFKDLTVSYTLHGRCI